MPGDGRKMFRMPYELSLNPLPKRRGHALVESDEPFLRMVAEGLAESISSCQTSELSDAMRSEDADYLVSSNWDSIVAANDFAVEYLPFRVPHKHVDVVSKLRKRVCIIGPESSGKSSLARSLSKQLRIVAGEEVARDYIRARNNVCLYKDMALMVRAQAALEHALVQYGGGAAIFDMCPLTTMIWSDTLFGRHESWIREYVDSLHYDLVLLMDCDIPWVYDPLRCLPNASERRAFFERCREELDSRAWNYAVISGGPKERFQRAMEMVTERADW